VFFLKVFFKVIEKVGRTIARICVLFHYLLLFHIIIILVYFIKFRPTWLVNLIPTQISFSLIKINIHFLLIFLNKTKFLWANGSLFKEAIFSSLNLKIIISSLGLIILAHFTLNLPLFHWDCLQTRSLLLFTKIIIFAWHHYLLIWTLIALLTDIFQHSFLCYIDNWECYVSFVSNIVKPLNWSTWIFILLILVIVVHINLY
jgi:hypothetical protein